MTAASGSFPNVLAALIQSPSIVGNTSYVVSIEVPDTTPSPSPSSQTWPQYVVATDQIG